MNILLNFCYYFTSLSNNLCILIKKNKKFFHFKEQKDSNSYLDSFNITYILLFFLIKKIQTMQKQINEISLKIALNLLNDYIKQRTQELIHIHERFAKDFINKPEVDLHQWLLDETKSINETVKNLLEGSKDYFTDLKFEFVYSFFQKCFQVLEQNSKYLAQVIIETINKKIDIVRPHIFIPPAPPVTVGTNVQQIEQPKEQKLKRYSKEINRDLQSLDYFLNLLAYEDNKTYEQYKSQCDKILLQRQLIENIKPSQASKEIMETANMIDNVMQNSDKVFQDSYMLKYMEFKSFMSDLKRPEELNDLYREDMENATKQKFKDGMNRTLKKCYAINKRQGQKNKISFGIQTDEIKGAKYQQKLQNLLIFEKKNNQKLTTQIKLLKKNKSSSQDQLELQKAIEREQNRLKEADNKYKILQNMYNQKCDELQKLPFQNMIVQKQQYKQQYKKQLISIGLQADPLQKKNISMQTDLDFYYYFESNKIYDYKVKIIQLEQQLQHKDYTIKQMEAIRTFRNNFKSKKQVYETMIRSSRKIDRAKTLHYLDEDDQVFDIRNEKNAELSLQGNTKKKVTLQDIDQSGQARNKTISHSKKSKKRTQIFKNKPYFALNSKIQDEVQQEEKSQCQNQKVSIKSILKLGSNQFKKEIGIQTQCDKSGLLIDYVIQQGIGKSKIQKVKLSSRDKSQRSTKISRLKARQSETSSHFKDSKQKKYQFDQGSLRKSNFVALGQLNDHKQQKQMNMTMTTPFRTSGISGVVTLPKRALQMKTEKPSYFTSASKWNESKVSTVGNEILHVNNSLNCNFLAPITTNLKQSISSSTFFKNKSKYESIKKPSKIL